MKVNCSKPRCSSHQKIFGRSDFGWQFSKNNFSKKYVKFKAHLESNQSGNVRGFFMESNRFFYSANSGKSFLEKAFPYRGEKSFLLGRNFDSFFPFRIFFSTSLAPSNFERTQNHGIYYSLVCFPSSFFRFVLENHRAWSGGFFDFKPKRVKEEADRASFPAPRVRAFAESSAKYGGRCHFPIEIVG